MYDRPEDRLKQMVMGRLFHRCYFRECHALRDLSLEMVRGETVGIVGRNGSGKSTLLQIICATLLPTSGEALVNGRISALLELGAGFNPEFTGKENIYLNASILGLSREEIDVRYADIVAFSGLDPIYLKQPVKTYSSGMYVRLAFSVAISVEPDILIVDEALAVGDEAFQRKCFARLQEIQKKGATILFVSHAAQTIIELCERAILLDAGEMLMDGTPKDVIAGYHRLIYAPGEKQAEIRDALKRGDISVEQPKENTPAEIAAYDAQMLSESRVEYAKEGGEITDVELVDAAGEPVNILHTGERYRYRYTLTLSDTAQQPKFGMLIKTKRGIDLGGAIAGEWYDEGRQLQAGDKVRVEFSFECVFRPGTYFVNCGCTKQVEGAEVFIHRIVDALQFKVIDPEKRDHIIPAGHIDLKVQCTVDT